jgi:hypothetical protein
MGYNIEVAFNVLKQSNVQEIEDKIINMAIDNNCNFYYDDFEFQTNIKFQRNHYVVTINFNNDINYIVKFIKNIRKIKGTYIESIYEDKSSQLLYASQYYTTQNMDKHLATKYKLNKRERSYSEDDTIILNTITPTKKYN